MKKNTIFNDIKRQLIFGVIAILLGEGVQRVYAMNADIDQDNPDQVVKVTREWLEKGKILPKQLPAHASQFFEKPQSFQAIMNLISIDYPNISLNITFDHANPYNTTEIKNTAPTFTNLLLEACSYRPRVFDPDNSFVDTILNASKGMQEKSKGEQVNINMKGYKSKTPLWLAVTIEMPQEVERLLAEDHLNPNIPAIIDNQKVYPLLQSVNIIDLQYDNSISILEDLVGDSKVQLDVVDVNENTLLHLLVDKIAQFQNIEKKEMKKKKKRNFRVVNLASFKVEDLTKILKSLLKGLKIDPSLKNKSKQKAADLTSDLKLKSLLESAEKKYKQQKRIDKNSTIYDDTITYNIKNNSKNISKITKSKKNGNNTPGKVNGNDEVQSNSSNKNVIGAIIALALIGSMIVAGGIYTLFSFLKNKQKTIKN